jgi:ribosomal-protein-alanine N-acetyltransferase
VNDYDHQPDNPDWILERILSEKALDEIIRLDRASFPRPWTPAMFVRVVRASDEFQLFALRRKGLAPLAGFLCCRLGSDMLQIATIAVREDLRRQGIGAMLVRFALEKAARDGARDVTLDVRVSNLAARRLYQRMGFVPVALHPRYYDKPIEDGLMYIRPLDEGVRVVPQDVELQPERRRARRAVTG